MPKVTVRVDPEVCITAANCTGVAPKLFHIGDEPYAELLDREGQPQGNHYTFDASAEELELLEEAAESCPTRAIAVTVGLGCSAGIALLATGFSL